MRTTVNLTFLHFRKSLDDNRNRNPPRHITNMLNCSRRKILAKGFWGDVINKDVSVKSACESEDSTKYISLIIPSPEDECNQSNDENIPPKNVSYLDHHGQYATDEILSLDNDSGFMIEAESIINDAHMNSRCIKPKPDHIIFRAREGSCCGCDSVSSLESILVETCPSSISHHAAVPQANLLRGCWNIDQRISFEDNNS